MRAIVAAAALAALTGCGLPMSQTGPPSADQSRAQVLGAARELVATLRLPVLQAAFWRAACGDGGRPPFRAQVRISYPRAAGYAQSEAEIAAMIRRLTETGWTAEPGFPSHSRALAKNGITALFRGQNASVSTRAVEVIGDCEDGSASPPGDGAEWVTLR